MSSLAIVQARMGSRRLPNKMMLWMNGKPLIGWIVERLSKLNEIDKVVFAIPETKHDDVLEYYLTQCGANIFRGSEDDLVDRYYRASQIYGAHEIVRVCADNPFILASEIDRLAIKFRISGADYGYNHIPRNNLYPNGVGGEICTFETLERIHSASLSHTQKEHLFNYVWDNESIFDIMTIDPLEKFYHRPDIRLDIDTNQDYLRLLSLGLKSDVSWYDLIISYDEHFGNETRHL
tara:strand:+ start:365 stop:1069 length:705 start_codon:yes stop_codon:yes gene_type:complete